MIYLGADHRGYKLKEGIKKYLSGFNFQFEDLGNAVFDKNDDYVDFAKAVSKNVGKNPLQNKGILFCGSGTGMAIVANKSRGIRAVVAFDEKIAKLSRQHNDANVLCLPADFLTEKKTEKIIISWIKEKFSKEKRHVRRIEKITKIEKGK